MWGQHLASKPSSTEQFPSLLISHSLWCIRFRQNTLEPSEHEVSSKLPVTHGMIREPVLELKPVLFYLAVQVKPSNRSLFWSGLSIRLQFLSGHIHLLRQGVLHGLQVDIFSSAWSTSFPTFFSDFGSAGLFLSHSLRPLSHFLLHSSFDSIIFGSQWVCLGSGLHWAWWQLLMCFHTSYP